MARTVSKNTGLLKKVNALKAKWSKSRKAKATKGLTCPDGTYEAQLIKANIGESKNAEKSLYFNFTFKITSPEEYAGQTGNVTHLVKHVTWQGGERTVEEVLEMVAKDLQNLGHETEDSDVSDLIEIMDQLNEEKPMVQLQVGTGKKKGNRFIYIQGLIDSDIEDSDEPEEDEEKYDEDEEGYDDAYDDEEETEEYDEEYDEEEEEDYEEEPEEDEEEIEEEDEYEIIPEKGEFYAYKPPRSRKELEGEIVTSNKRNKTVTIKCDNGKTYKEVSFDDLIAYEDE